MRLENTNTIAIIRQTKHQAAYLRNHHNTRWRLQRMNQAKQTKKSPSDAARGTCDTH